MGEFKIKLGFMRYTKFPKWYQSFRPEFGYQIVEFEISKFRGINIIEEIELPLKLIYITLDEKKLDLFFEDITTHIIEKYPFVSDVRFEESLYNQDRTKNINSNTRIFDTGWDSKNIREIYEFKNFKKYFKGNDIYYDVKHSSSPSRMETIGYTNKSKEQLSKGVELPVRITLGDEINSFEEHIFIIGLKSIYSSNSRYEYFIEPENMKEQLLNEFRILSKKYLNFKRIVLDRKVFSKETVDLISSKNFVIDYKNGIKSYIKYEYDSETGINQILQTSPSPCYSRYHSSGDTNFDEFDIEDFSNSKNDVNDLNTDDINDDIDYKNRMIDDILDRYNPQD